MAEAGKIINGSRGAAAGRGGRTKSITDIRAQMARINEASRRALNRVNTSNASLEERDAEMGRQNERVLRASQAARVYANNMINSPTMRRVFRASGGGSSSDWRIFTSPFGAGMDVQVPVRQYRKNRR